MEAGDRRSPGLGASVVEGFLEAAGTGVAVVGATITPDYGEARARRFGDRAVLAVTAAIAAGVDAAVTPLVRTRLGQT